jgi:biopolymer transport protein ExbD
MEAMRVDPSTGGRRSKKNMVTTLILTSLVDAFSIMLLYLLVQNTGNGSSLELLKSEKLPTAVRAEALHEGTLIRFDGRNYFLGEQRVEQFALAQKLQELRHQLTTQNQGSTQSANLSSNPSSNGNESANALIIQADRSVDFASLTPVIRAASISGFNKFKFAVLQGETKL